jgi:hypothetical protein
MYPKPTHPTGVKTLGEWEVVRMAEGQEGDDDCANDGFAE